MSEKSTFRVRFRYNQQTGEARGRQELQKAGARFAQMVVNRVALEYADEKYEELRATVAMRIGEDVRNEIEHVARQYRRFVVGSEANQRSMRGQLTTNTVGGEKQGLKSFNIGGTNWAPRSKRYLQNKMNNPKFGHNRWFEHDGVVGNMLGKGSTWTEIFGPVKVRLIRQKTPNGMSLETSKLLNKRQNGSGVFSIARIEVSAFEKITPAMLPALASRDMNAAVPDGRKSGLLELVMAGGGQEYRDLAHGLGYASQVPYRSTLEPFLAFTLTRAIPAAVAAKINNGLNSRNLKRVYKE